MKPNDAQNYKALYVAACDLDMARSYARYILKKGWHGWSVLRRGSVRVQQGAFTEALIIAYGRLWSPPVLKGFAWSDAEDVALHKQFMQLRNKVIGHSTPPNYSVKPWVGNEFCTHIFSRPYPCFTPAELGRLDDMLGRIIDEIQERRFLLLTTYVGPDKARKMLLT